MTIDPIVALPALLSAVLVYRVSAEAAFYRVYLPVLLLLPDNFIWGWPTLNFHQFAILPIGLALCWWVFNGRWRWSWTDFVVFSFIGWIFVSDFHANPSGDFINRIAYPVTLAVFPYMAGKLLIEQGGLRIAVAKRIVFFVFIDVIISVYEFRFAANPFRHTFQRFFSSVDPWFTQVRYGFGRTSGPFGHAIFMGAIIAIAILLHRYVAHFGLWERKFRWFPRFPMEKRTILFWVLVLGSVMTISRGPWLAAIVGAIVASIGMARNRRRAFLWTAGLLICGGTLFYTGAKSFAASAGTSSDYTSSKEEVASAEYRAKLWDQYEDIALMQSVWGWGSADWPKVPGMSSIDNWYLLLMLMYGVTGLVLFVVMLMVPIFQLIWTGMLDTEVSGDQRALLFTMGGGLLSIGVAIATVFLGGQLYPLLFLLLGWSDACLKYRPRRLFAAPAFAFRKVIA